MNQNLTLPLATQAAEVAATLSARDCPLCPARKFVQYKYHNFTDQACAVKMAG